MLATVIYYTVTDINFNIVISTIGATSGSKTEYFSFCSYFNTLSITDSPLGLYEHAAHPFNMLKHFNRRAGYTAFSRAVLKDTLSKSQLWI